MKELIQILHTEGLTLVVKSENGAISRYTQRGVKDLLTLVIDHREVLRHAMIADKAVGKAAAACMARGGVGQVYADVMSEPALALLQSQGITASYGTLVHHIINRSGDDWCPMEKMSRDLDDIDAIIEGIEAFIGGR